MGVGPRLFVLSLFLVATVLDAASRSRSLSRTQTASLSGTQSQAPSFSGTQSQVETSSVTPTKSPSQRKTPTESQSPSYTRTPSATQTVSTGLTRTMTPSQTSSQTQSASQSASESGTPSQSPSMTSSQSQSESQSASVTQSSSQSASQTQSSSQSASQSQSSSQSASMTQSSSQSGSMTSSQSASQTRTQTQRNSGTNSQTPTHTSTPSPTRSRSPTGSETSSQTPTKSSTMTQSASRTAPLPTQTPTASLTQTASSSPSAPVPSQTPTASPSIPPRTWSLSQSPTGSGSISPTMTGTASGSSTLSATHTATSSQTRSRSPTESRTASRSPSHTVTASPSRSSTPSPSQTASGSEQASLSFTQSPTKTLGTTASPSAVSPSESRAPPQSQSQTQVASVIPGTSQSPTPTPTPSSSSAPYHLSLSPTQPTVNGALALSDSLAPAVLFLSLSRCPVIPAERLAALACWVGSAEPGIAANSSTGVNAATLDQLLPVLETPVGLLSMTCDASASAPSAVAVPAVISILPAFRTPAFDSQLICALSGSNGAVMGNATLNVSVTATLWPAFDDCIVLASNGFSRSVGGLGVVNTTAALLAAASNSSEARRLLISRSLASSSAVTTLFDTSVILAAMEAAWGGVSLSHSAGPAAFSLTLFGATPLVLRSAARAFSPLTNVSVGGVPCNGTVASLDGQWLAFVTPGPDELCGSSGSDCTYATLVVSNPGTPPLQGAVLACPPFCAGSLSAGSGVVPLFAGPSDFVPATVQPDGLVTALAPDAFGTAAGTGGGGAAASAQASSPVYPAGLYFAAACFSTGIYTDPTTGACTNASDPRFSLCAFGSSAACAPCPANAMCPGGFRAWPRAGYFTPSESSGVILQCGEPDATSRCLGWSGLLQQTQCGVGYLQGSYLCGACAPEYFLDTDGTCQACPAVGSVWDRYGKLVLLFVCVAGFLGLLFAALLPFVIAQKRSLKKLLQSIATLLVFLLTVVQVLSNVSQVNSGRLPLLLRSVYRGIALLQLQGVTLPPACTHAYYFESQVSLMATGLGLWYTAAALSLLRWAFALRGKLFSHAILAAALGAVYLHPSISSAALELVSCQSVALTQRAVDALQRGAALVSGGGSGRSSSSGSTSLSSVSLLTGNPYIVCFEGPHLPAGALACVTLALFVGGLPALSLLLLWYDPWLRAQTHRGRAQASTLLQQQRGVSGKGRTEKKIAKIAATASASAAGSGLAQPPVLAPFLKLSSYTVDAWYWRHVDMAVVLGLAALGALLPLPSTLAQLAVKLSLTLGLLAGLLTCLVVLPNPYTEPWKWYLRLSLVVLSMSCVVVNGASRALDLGYGGATLLGFIVPASYINISILCATVAVALVAFVRSQVLGGQDARRRLPVLPAPAAAAVAPARVGSAAAPLAVRPFDESVEEEEEEDEEGGGEEGAEPGDGEDEGEEEVRGAVPTGGGKVLEQKLHMQQQAIDVGSSPHKRRGHRPSDSLEEATPMPGAVSRSKHGTTHASPAEAGPSRARCSESLDRMRSPLPMHAVTLCREAGGVIPPASGDGKAASDPFVLPDQFIPPSVALYGAGGYSDAGAGPASADECGFHEEGHDDGAVVAGLQAPTPLLPYAAQSPEYSAEYDSSGYYGSQAGPEGYAHPPPSRVQHRDLEPRHPWQQQQPPLQHGQQLRQRPSLHPFEALALRSPPRPRLSLHAPQEDWQGTPALPAEAALADYPPPAASDWGLPPGSVDAGVGWAAAAPSAPGFASHPASLPGQPPPASVPLHRPQRRQASAKELDPPASLPLAPEVAAEAFAVVQSPPRAGAAPPAQWASGSVRRLTGPSSSDPRGPLPLARRASLPGPVPSQAEGGLLLVHKPLARGPGALQRRRSDAMLHAGAAAMAAAGGGGGQHYAH